MSLYQGALREKTKQLKAMAGELNMAQAQVGWVGVGAGWGRGGWEGSWGQAWGLMLLGRPRQGRGEAALRGRRGRASEAGRSAQGPVRRRRPVVRTSTGPLRVGLGSVDDHCPRSLANPVPAAGRRVQV